MALRREAREADSFFEEDQSLEGEGRPFEGWKPGTGIPSISLTTGKGVF